MMIKSLGALYQHLCQAPLTPSSKASLKPQQSLTVNVPEKSKRTQSERWQWALLPRPLPATKIRRARRLPKKREGRSLQAGGSRRLKKRPDGPKASIFFLKILIFICDPFNFTAAAAGRAVATEARRLQRMAGRHAHMTCFACRQVGHSAKDCPTIHEGSTTATTKTKTSTEAAVVAVVGICYRCGSRKHNLARCRQPVQPDDPLPYASCFVCSGSGHLASSCPQNNGRGVYPNGGSCKLCGETTHLARDCTLRKIGQQSILSPFFVASSNFLTKYLLLVLLLTKMWMNRRGRHCDVGGYGPGSWRRRGRLSYDSTKKRRDGQR